MEQGLEWARVVDAGVGGIIGLAVVALLLPIDPIRVLDRAVAPVTANLNRQLREVARALVHIQLRTMASDLLRATGRKPATANKLVREAAAF